jgi:hypothetical protein
MCVRSGAFEVWLGWLSAGFSTFYTLTLSFDSITMLSD